MADNARSQCNCCPWKKTTNPRDIPNGYCEIKHANLKSTIADPEDPLSTIAGDLHIMGCHAPPAGVNQVCVGWLANQLGPGNNIGLRLAMAGGKFSKNYKVVGPQHTHFEDTLPKDEMDEC